MSDDQGSWRFMDDYWFNVTFIHRRHDAQSVSLTGDFCGWDPDVHVMRPCPEGFSVTLLLCEGFYEYKFCVDGKLVSDEHNPLKSVNYGNSIMFVHMDPSVYGFRNLQHPHRDYFRPGADGAQFQVLWPDPRELASVGILKRPIYVYLPPSYFSDPSQRFPVLYTNDGQNIFSTAQDRGGPNGGGWYLDAKLDHFWSQGELMEFILVGVPNSDFVCIGNRSREYCTREFSNVIFDPYTRYLVEVVKEEVDSNYRTLPDRENSFMLGASMGGLQAFITCLNRSDVFSGVVCISPSLWFVDSTNKTAFDLVNTLSVKDRDSPPRVYLDAGDCPTDNCQVAKQMQECFHDNGWAEGRDFIFHLEPTREGVDMHAEWVWRERVIRGLTFIFKRP